MGFKDMYSCKTGLQKENVVSVKTDKSNGVLILKEEDYTAKCEGFIKHNKLQNSKIYQQSKFPKKLSNM